MCIIEIDKSHRLNETAPSALARWYSDRKYTDLMTCSAPTSLDSSAACFGIVEGSADYDFGKYGSVRTGDLSTGGGHQYRGHSWGIEGPAKLNGPLTATMGIRNGTS